MQVRDRRAKRDARIAEAEGVEGVVRTAAGVADDGGGGAAEPGLVTAGQTPSALPEVSAGAVKVTKGHESTLDVWAESTLGGDIWLVAADKEVVVDVTGTTSA